MRNDSPPDADRRVRDAFAVKPDAVARVAAAALRAERPRARRYWAPGLIATGAVALLGAALALWPPRHPVPAPDVETVSGSLTDGVLVVPLPDGSVSISGGASRDDRPPDGCGIVFVEGGLK